MQHPLPHHERDRVNVVPQLPPQQGGQQFAPLQASQTQANIEAAIRAREENPHQHDSHQAALHAKKVYEERCEARVASEKAAKLRVQQEQQAQFLPEPQQ